jgi:hypothetical protein
MVMRKGMWLVVNKEEVGILFDFTPDGFIVHVVNDDGETIRIDEVNPKTVRQCKYHEIPYKRRGFTRTEASKLGY